MALPRLFAPSFTHNWVADGDSITVANSGLDYPTYVLQAISGLNGPWKVQNVAVIGETVATMLANAVSVVDSKYDAAQVVNVCSIMGGTNDLSAGRTPAQIWADLQTYCTGRRNKGFKVILCTILTRDFLASANLVTQAMIDSLNALIRAGWQSVADALCDFAAISYFSAFPLSDDRYVFQSDQLHPITTIPRRLLADAIAPFIYGFAPYASGAPFISNVFCIGGGSAVASSGGTDVYISGANLGSASITENGVAVTTTVVSANHVKYTTAAHTGTSAALQISASSGGNTSAPSYATITYTAPAVTSVTPTSVNTGGSSIAVAGMCFGSGCAVYLGTVDGAHQCTSVVRDTYHPEQALTCVTPAALAAGTYGVIVVNSDGQQSGAATTLTLASPAAPTVTGVDTENATTAGSIPMSVITGGAGGAGVLSNKVVITGTNFTGTTAVKFTCGAVDIPVASFVVNSATSITAVLGDASALLTTAGGMCTCTVTNATGSNAPFANAAYYLPSGAIAGHVANRGVTLNSGNVSTLADFIGSNNMAQATSTQQPLFVASAINSKPAWQPDGSGAPLKFLAGTMSATYTGTALTIVAWVSRINTPGNAEIMAGWPTGATAAGSVAGGFYLYDVPGSDVRIRRNGSFLSQLNSPIVNATPCSIGVRFDGTNCYSRRNGTDGPSGASTAAFSMDFFSYGIGWNVSAPGEPESKINFAGALMFNRALVSADYTSLSTYSNANWAIANT